MAIVVAVAVIVFAPQISAAILGALAISSSIAVALLAAALTIGAGLVLSSLTAKSGKPSAADTGVPAVFRQSITNSFIVYGRRRVAGMLAFFHSRVVGSTHYRYFVIAAAGHHCQGNETWMLNDEVVTVDGSHKVTSGAYANAAWLWFQKGEASETANATFVSECGGNWTTAHQGNGIAAIYAKFQMTDAVVQAGMPNITAVIDGKDDIADPRDDSTGFTNNAALVIYDWMKLPREEGGFGAYADEIPDDDWISAQANVCDETIHAEARYALDAVITTGAAPSEVRDSLVLCCAGSYTFSEGKHLVRVGYWVPPSETLSESDLAGPIQVSPFLTSDQAANEVQGTFIDPDAGYQGAAFGTQTLDPPPDDIKQADLDLPYITSKYRAERIARIALRRAAAEKTVTWPMNIMGLRVSALDLVQLGTARYGLSNYAWVTTSWSLSADFGIVLSLREENEEIYDDAEPSSAASPPAIAAGEPVTTLAELQKAIRTAYPTGLTLTGQDDSGDAQIVISDHVHEWPGYGAIAVTGTTLTGLTFEATYYTYADLDTIADPAPTFGATTNYADALNSNAHPLRMYLNQAVTLPASGGGSTGGGGIGGGYGGGGGGVIP